MHHSPEAIANYLSTFTRCAQLAQKKISPEQIAVLLRRGLRLIRAYLDSQSSGFPVFDRTSRTHVWKLGP